MTGMERKFFLNPITFAANLFLKTLERHGAQYQLMDDELHVTMDKLVDAINRFYDQSLTKVEKSEDSKVVRVEGTDYVIRSFQCLRCSEFLEYSTENARPNISKAHQQEAQSQNTDRLKLLRKARFLLTTQSHELLMEAFRTAESLKKIPEYRVIEDDLMRCLRCSFPDKKFKIYKFGSRISGLGSTTSDLDIFVAIDDNFYNYNAPIADSILDVAKKLSTVLKMDKKWTEEVTNENKNVPIIRLHHVSTNIHCDIGFSNSLGCCNTMLMEYFFELQPIAARMSIFLKLWLERTKLDKRISTYSFTLMVIYYLQIRFALPSIENLQKDLEKKELIGPWISNFQKKSLKELNLKSEEVSKAILREHMNNFFTFYSEFDYKHRFICPYKGKRVKIVDMTKDFPERYQDFVKSCRGHVELQMNTPIVVQDPLELGHNVTKGISRSLLEVLVAYFRESAKRMRSS